MNFTFDPTLFGLVGARLTGLIIASPGISESYIPRIIRAALVTWLTIFMVPFVPKSFVPSTSLFGDFISMGAEMILGIGLGLVIKLIFAGIELAGTLIDSELGMLAGSQLNPLFPQSPGKFSQIFDMIGLYYFWILGYFPLLLLSIQQSFVVLPPGGFSTGASLGELMLRLSAGLFTAGLAMAAPIIALNFLQTVAIGFFVKSVQGINIFYESFTIRIVVGFSGVVLFLPLLLIFMRDQFEYIIPDSTRYFQAFFPLPPK